MSKPRVWSPWDWLLALIQETPEQMRRRERQLAEIQFLVGFVILMVMLICVAAELPRIAP